MVITTKPTCAAKHKNKNRKNTELKAWADTRPAYISNAHFIIIGLIRIFFKSIITI